MWPIIKDILCTLFTVGLVVGAIYGCSILLTPYVGGHENALLLTAAVLIVLSSVCCKRSRTIDPT